ncbi:hypothetical protein MKZ38_002390 [Zalerion maritima]|uniref:RTA1-like protein n=1 Tax=Zalerion maritima TaxID=339359 RepID=A0AAD5RPS6_9PEZI|nr:hypothetical protein MKZ38_002390 [Zalerion maritima]
MATPTILFLRSETSDTADSECTTAVPDKYGYVPPESCNANYGYYPNFEANLAFAVLFGITLAAHFGQAFFFKKVYAWVAVMGASWELVAFAVRTYGAHNQQSLDYVVIGTLFLLLAPLWLNAFCFMTVARLVYYVVEDQAIWRFKAGRMTKIFVWLDIISFLVQAIGGTMLSQEEQDVVDIGQKVYMAGVGFQLAFIIVFLAIIVKFFLMIRANEVDSPHANTRRVSILLGSLAACLILIIIRIIYRLIEFGEGANEDNELLHSEWYAICLDGLPMLLAFLVLNVVHPGIVLKGPESEFPKLTRAEKKQLKQAKKDAKLQAKKDRKEGGKNVYGYENMTPNSHELLSDTGRTSPQV